MSEENENGGFAFPREARINPHGVLVHSGSAGMTLRDYFAGNALVGLVSQKIDIETMQRKVSVLCYEYADAMLEARK